MKIGIDFDGVIADTTHLKHEIAERLFGVRVDDNRFKEELVIADGILTREQYRTIMNEICLSEETGLRMRPCPDSISCITELLADGHALTVITSRNEHEIQVAKKWCTLHGIELPFVSVGYNTAKTDAVRNRSIDAYIDDDMHKLVPLQGIVPNLFIYVISTADESYCNDGIMRANWRMFQDEIRKRS